MKYLKLIIVIVMFAFLGCQTRISLFEENSREAWLEHGDAQWGFSNGEIVGSLAKGMGFIMTKEAYGDFELELEFYPDESINSGIFIRCKEYKLSFSDCYEINIWDDHPNQDNRTGAIVSRTTPLLLLKTVNQWNMYKIKCNKNRIRAWINGVLIADLESDDLAKGYIGLQAGGSGTIKFKNIKIKVQ